MSNQRTEELRFFDLEYLEEEGLLLAGIDEAGRGPLAGPVVAGAVIVKDPAFNRKIDDSKKLSFRQREAAFEEILEKCHVSCAFVGPDRIDAINIYQATLEAMRKAFFGLKEKVGVVLVDGPMPLDLPCPVKQIPGGDGKSLSVACASIVAKVARDRLMLCYAERYPVYGFQRHKGYGTELHMKSLSRYGPCPIHRRTFAPVGSSVKELNIEELKELL